jgi:hypothetical protein
MSPETFNFESSNINTNIMTTRLQDNQLKGIFFLILFTVLTVHSALTGTPSGSLKTQNFYNGSAARLYELSTPVSNVQKIHTPVTSVRTHR